MASRMTQATCPFTGQGQGYSSRTFRALDLAEQEKDDFHGAGPFREGVTSS